MAEKSSYFSRENMMMMMKRVKKNKDENKKELWNDECCKWRRKENMGIGEKKRRE